jgi:hypothetical protein
MLTRKTASIGHWLNLLYEEKLNFAIISVWKFYESLSNSYVYGYWRITKKNNIYNNCTVLFINKNINTKSLDILKKEILKNF